MTHGNNAFFNATAARRLIILIMIVSLLGFVDAGFLAWKHYSGNQACVLGGNCDQVLASRYATLGSIPIALVGALYYLGIFLAASFAFRNGRDALLDFVARFTVVGLLASVWLVVLQFFVIHAICGYCIMSATASTFLFVAGMALLILKGRHEKRNRAERI